MTALIPSPDERRRLVLASFEPAHLEAIIEAIRPVAASTVRHRSTVYTEMGRFHGTTVMGQFLRALASGDRATSDALSSKHPSLSRAWTELVSSENTRTLAERVSRTLDIPMPESWRLMAVHNYPGAANATHAATDAVMATAGDALGLVRGEVTSSIRQAASGNRDLRAAAEDVLYRAVTRTRIHDLHAASFTTTSRYSESARAFLAAAAEHIERLLEADLFALFGSHRHLTLLGAGRLTGETSPPVHQQSLIGEVRAEVARIWYSGEPVQGVIDVLVSIFDVPPFTVADMAKQPEVVNGDPVSHLSLDAVAPITADEIRRIETVTRMFGERHLFE